MSKRGGRKGFGGLTAQEFSRRHSWEPGARCDSCSAVYPVGRVVVMAPFKDAVAKGLIAPEMPSDWIAERTMTLYPSGEPELFVRVSKMYYCERCKKDVQREVAKQTPSWCVAEFNEGPAAYKPIVSV